jgi:hypothetical protein
MVGKYVQIFRIKLTRRSFDCDKQRERLPFCTACLIQPVQKFEHFGLSIDVRVSILNVDNQGTSPR